MTVKELIVLLLDEPLDNPVCLKKDLRPWSCEEVKITEISSGKTNTYIFYKETD
jgi:hypothetical protein